MKKFEVNCEDRISLLVVGEREEIAAIWKAVYRHCGYFGSHNILPTHCGHPKFTQNYYGLEFYEDEDGNDLWMRVLNPRTITSLLCDKDVIMKEVKSF